MDVHEIQGQKFKAIRDLNGSILRLVPINPGNMATRWNSDEEESESESLSYGYPFAEESEYVEEIQEMAPREMLSRSTQEIDEPVSASESTESDKAESISSEGSESVEISEQEFPTLIQNESKTQISCEVLSVPLVDVCYKPTYRTIKMLQMRAGPGANFEPTAVIPAKTDVQVLADGLAECTPEMFQKWWKLHVSGFDNKVRMPSLRAIKNRKESWKSWAYNLGYSVSFVEFFLKQIRVADRKVKVAVTLDGEVKYGWISKRKQSGPMIQRVFGSSLPVVQVDNLGDASNCTFAFAEELRKFRNEHSFRMPPRAFYNNLLKKATGCKKVEWEFRWVQNRSLGMDTQTLSDGRLRTGYYQPESTAFLVYSSLRQANTFIKNANEKLGSLNRTVEADFEPNFGNVSAVPAAECPVEWSMFTQNKTSKQEAGIFSVSAL